MHSNLRFGFGFSIVAVEEPLPKMRSQSDAAIVASVIVLVSCKKVLKLSLYIVRNLVTKNQDKVTKLRTFLKKLFRWE